jgi:hypothetical protein
MRILDEGRTVENHQGNTYSRVLVQEFQKRLLSDCAGSAVIFQDLPTT